MRFLSPGWFSATVMALQWLTTSRKQSCSTSAPLNYKAQMILIGENLVRPVILDSLKEVKSKARLPDF